MRGPIPYYAQTAEFSCGAASLVMALHALRSTPLTRREEFRLWRDGTMIGTMGMCQWGVAASALKRDVPATVVSPSELTFPRESQHARAKFTEEQLELSRFAQRENRDRAEELGAHWLRRDPTLDDVADALATDRVPILLVDLYTLTDGAYPAPHWVVVTEATDRLAVFHDPDPDGPGVRKLALDEAWAAGDVSRYLAERALVVLGP